MERKWYEETDGRVIGDKIVRKRGGERTLDRE